MTVEQRVAQLLANEPSINWHVASIVVGHAYKGDPDRDRHVAGFLRRVTLGYIGSALHEGFDGGEVAPRPRNANEHRRGEVYVGSMLLHQFDRFDGIDWWTVDAILQPLLTPVDTTPPLRREAAAA